ncbi:MAG: hypothetical protein CM1200mP2_08840 [Planctomycetaceae bacterium]|nr:MAG: hypothetical protein CM1200mP2_08840 [Planctomycetaceae bacterium]
MFTVTRPWPPSNRTSTRTDRVGSAGRGSRTCPRPTHRQRHRFASLRQGPDGRLRRSAEISPTGRRVDGRRRGDRRQVASKTVASGQAIQIMTGAPMPDGADAVVRVEDTQTENKGDQVWSRSTPKPGHRRPGHDPAGDLDATGRYRDAGRTPLRPQELGLLAELGPKSLTVIAGCGWSARHRRRTGRHRSTARCRANPQLERDHACRQVRACGGEAVELGIARDTPEDLATITAGSTGRPAALRRRLRRPLDLVPAQLEAAGPEVFHKVKVKPGKPVWFGPPGTPSYSACRAIRSVVWSASNCSFAPRFEDSPDRPRTPTPRPLV